MAYLKADMHGGTGTQAVVAWRDGEVCLDPATTTFGWPPPHQSTRPRWAFNRALRALDAVSGDAIDEFDAAALGAHRSTGDWLAAAAEGDRSRGQLPGHDNQPPAI